MNGAQLSRFLRRIQTYHCRTPGRTFVPIHYDDTTKDLVQYPWPCDPESGQRVAPSMLEEHQRTHEFQAPCCLCAFLDGKDYVEASIGIIEEARTDSAESPLFLNGQYVAICARRRCGYILCFERFYTVHGLRLQVYPKRLNPLPAKELNIFSNLGRLQGPYNESLLQIVPVFRGLPRAIIRQDPTDRRAFARKPYKHDIMASEKLRRQFMFGMPLTAFAERFVQCVVCKAVILREGVFPYHECASDNLKRARRLAQSKRHHAIRVIEGNGRIIEVKVTTRDGEMEETYSLGPEPVWSSSAHTAASEIVPDSQPSSPSPAPV